MFLAWSLSAASSPIGVVGMLVQGQCLGQALSVVVVSLGSAFYAICLLAAYSVAVKCCGGFKNLHSEAVVQSWLGSRLAFEKHV